MNNCIFTIIKTWWLQSNYGIFNIISDTSIYRISFIYMLRFLVGMFHRRNWFWFWWRPPWIYIKSMPAGRSDTNSMIELGSKMKSLAQTFQCIDNKKFVWYLPTTKLYNPYHYSGHLGLISLKCQLWIKGSKIYLKNVFKLDSCARKTYK